MYSKNTFGLLQNPSHLYTARKTAKTELLFSKSQNNFSTPLYRNIKRVKRNLTFYFYNLFSEEAIYYTTDKKAEKFRPLDVEFF